MKLQAAGTGRLPLAKPDFDQRELEAVRRVLESGWVVQGPEVAAFEDAIADMHRARHCVAVSSGTAALHVAYLALDIGAGDAVFVPSFAWPSAANMAVVTGARPVFVDVLPDTYNIDPDDLRVQIERCRRHGWGKPRAVVPVHQFGLAADMAEVLAVAAQYDLEVIEDAACALGTTYDATPVGTLGRLGIFSFHPRKAVTTGEGGAIVTDDDELADRCRVWRNHGQETIDGVRDFRLAGMNYRLTEIQAAIGRVQLAKLPEIAKKRCELVRLYFEQLADCPGITLPQANAEHTWQTFMIVLDARRDRREFIERLAGQGIEVGPGSVAGHLAAFYRERFGYNPDDLPVAERLHHLGVAIPLFSSMDREELGVCVKALRAVANSDYVTGSKF